MVGGAKAKAKATCVRQVANWSRIQPHNKYDTKAFSAEKTASDMPIASPKMKAMFDKIAALDIEDMRSMGHLYKHMIFSDVRSGGYGAKILAAGFAARGYRMAYDERFVLDEAALRANGSGNTVAVLCSTDVYGKPIGVRFKKQILTAFNRRPENIHGEGIRFIILDQGFKEGIDLFDIKYIHLFEPLVTPADEQQVIGRGTRFCGQKGIEFIPGKGWPLNVFRYENIILDEQADKYDSGRLFELYLRYSGIDLRQIVFANELEGLAIAAAVDEQLTKTVHNFELVQPGWFYGGRGRVPKATAKAKAKQLLAPPMEVRDFLQMRRFVRDNYSGFAWPAVKLENQCIGGGGGELLTKQTTRGGELLAKQTGGAEIVKFTPTQDFLRNYFQPASIYKGLLLWHSVGTGKSCTAIAIASSSFEREGYTILWVTRHTLRSDVWKNMFGQVCNIAIQDSLKQGKTVPALADIKRPLDLLSKSWMSPISYKQFSNMLLKRNNIYNQMVARNGAADPLRKTLVIIDEVHKLYAADVVGVEKPDVGVLNQWIQNSYQTSGADSARLLLMSATPYTASPMELISILNMCRPTAEQMPDKFGDFASKYLGDDGHFTKPGGRQFLNDITGYISYLNRSKDARQFAYPVISNITVPMSIDEADPAALRLFDNKNELVRIRERLSGLDEQQAKYRSELALCANEETPEDTAACIANGKAAIAEGVVERKTLEEQRKVIRGEMKGLRGAVVRARGFNLSQEANLDKCLSA